MHCVQQSAKHLQFHTKRALAAVVLLAGACAHAAVPALRVRGAQWAGQSGECCRAVGTGTGRCGLPSTKVSSPCGGLGFRASSGCLHTPCAIVAGSWQMAASTDNAAVVQMQQVPLLPILGAGYLPAADVLSIACKTCMFLEGKHTSHCGGAVAGAPFHQSLSWRMRSCSRCCSGSCGCGQQVRDMEPGSTATAGSCAMYVRQLYQFSSVCVCQLAKSRPSLCAVDPV